ncbi:hypothetical protein A2853_03040 [Candidatus Kaiserbacteria bacterium RIFCSPHIGHO2_01_FULL_55_17]|uniref:HTH deoR-type domain-containing protein n=1 Tax=Candidatus Kaiserbacteria bacterium RIFCSPHIGHO2_01_FULL_55_17 TaxID=1798484 RepID=A0A1F6D8V2_9BACT|nr:MAG: hypothetical protein A2853_03040 [Candidatus Kaiserbacteria bacterium RIFCSPHIGHO2_01_FULL_55_17]
MDTDGHTMDDIKDIAQKSHVSQFLDSTTIRTDVFGQNVSGDRAYRRAERIVVAIHLVTNHIPAGEPVRVAVRSAGLRLLSSILGLRDEMRAPGSEALKGTETQIRKLISFMQVTSASGHVSSQNAGALIAALDELGVFLVSSQRTGLSETVLLNKDELLTLGTKHAAHSISDTRHKKRSQYIKDVSGQSGGVSDSDTKAHGRAEEIVGVLGTKGQLGIKDIAANLPEYSEKMIQRELRDLVAIGRVKKAGAKRWSTYALAQ